MIVPVAAGIADVLEHVRTVRAAGDIPLVRDPRWPDAQWEAAVAVARAAGDLDEIAWATLTSGTSGAARIVLRSAPSWAESFAAVSALLEATGADIIAAPSPPSSSQTLFSIAHALEGGPRVALGPVDRDSRATCLHGTPHALRAVLEAGVPPRMRAALIGGSHLDTALRAEAEAAGIRVVAYYGAAELSFVAVDHGDGLRPFPGVDLDVRAGELWVRSPFIASAYVGGSGPLRRDGAWATVGDRAVVEDGRLRLRGRADDAILSASATIVPEEIEEVLRSVPGVRDAVVFGMPRERVGALVAALLELDPDRVAEVPGALAHEVARRIAPPHRPRQWFVGELPRTTMGKPARAEAARRAVNGEVPRLVVRQ